ncbi:hypothetical protein BU23DRAFT_598455 [Bimuria novae-zelandiae CBS 107.79]|uniref:F-box domain-containing protein n=1 Tax=Bimuria novae-zelandiae CBS 107.79 TaxID=1447943 RepID=A0A6A5VDI1_9PLEO|nr:hypothetical protein BU23DRAFT_598455 [Bimuria novae-zelandiae CBS 107.79]
MSQPTGRKDAMGAAERLPLALRPLDFHKRIAVNDPAKAYSRHSTLTSLPYEILEACLFHLPVQDLLLCQCVCQRFRNIVASSHPIRRALFLEPAHHNGNLESWTLLKFNPFLAAQLAGSFNIRVIGVHRGKEGVKMVAHMRYEKEALLDDDWADILLRDEATWKSMLVTQPPATLLMHPSASVFWKTSLEQSAPFYRDDNGFTILDALDCVDW